VGGSPPRGHLGQAWLLCAHRAGSGTICAKHPHGFAPVWPPGRPAAISFAGRSTTAPLSISFGARQVGLCSRSTAVGTPAAMGVNCVCVGPEARPPRRSLLNSGVSTITDTSYLKIGAPFPELPSRRVRGNTSSITAGGSGERSAAAASYDQLTGPLVAAGKMA